jgi:hypothetical protein
MRPCACDRLPPAGEPYAPGFCRPCWLYHNRPDYRRKWDGGAEPADARPIGPPCTYRLPATGEQVECPACGGGRVKLKVFGCGMHGRCTINRRAEGIQTCAGCPSRIPPGEASHEAAS